MSSSTGASRAARSARRLDALDGLRTIAVFLVLAYHVNAPGVLGGFLGVDVFFVLSGFLITSLLLAEVSRRGAIDLGRFWMRRILRLMPASLVVIVTVVLWGMLYAPPFRRPALGADVLWSLLYVGNWRFISTSSYFADDGTQSPLQHVWSLAVEEQFYFVWPLVLAALTAVVLRRFAVAEKPLDSAARNERNAARLSAMARGAGWSAAVLAGLSAALLWFLYDPTGPDRAYMGTDTKAFEPLLGAAAAALMVSPDVRRWVTRHSQLLMAAGLTAVTAGVMVLGGVHAPAPAYFRGGAAVFALACAILVSATSVADRRRGLTLVLGSTPMAYLGRISYGIYLWHWPLTTWIVGDTGFSPRRAALVVTLTVVLAAASYHLIEVPIRSGSLARGLPRRVVPASLGLVAVAALVAAPLGGTPLNAVVPAFAAGTGGNSTMVVVGDSVMRRLVPSLAQTAQARGLTTLSAARGGCPALGVNALDGKGTPLSGGKCATEVPATQTQLVQQARPGVVLWWSRYELADRVGPGGHVLKAGTDAFWAAQRADLSAAVDRLTATGATLVMVEVDRTGKGIDSRCSPSACDPFLARLRNDDAIRVEWNRIVDDVARSDPRVEVIRMDDLYCRGDGNPCDDRLPVRAGPDASFRAPSGAGYARPDGTHFADAAMEAVTNGLLDRVAGVAPLGRAG